IAPLTGTGFRQLFFVLSLLVCPFGGHRHFMPLHYWLKRCNCLYMALEIWDWLEKHFPVFKAFIQILA
ncbi:hypothetical protein ACSLOR_29180, partial [Klebsiella pneumoniae]|uniref:hypothetical protein n=1 Tax=Klebsiella pneumoniae TaxID=573 RepID=UPI003EDE7BA2